MEHEEDSLDVENLVCTPTDSGLPMSPAHLHLPLPLPLPLPPSSRHMIMNNTDHVAAQSSAQAVAAGKKLEQEFELPADLTCTPTSTDVELVRDYLRPAIQRMQLEECSIWDCINGPAVVNPDLPTMDPCQLPGMIARNNKGGNELRDKYYLTDHNALAPFGYSRVLHTTNGFWQTHDSTVIRAEHNRVVGVKKTMKFHLHTGAKTNWIMNVYYSLIEGDPFIQNGLVLCHVLEADSAPDYGDNPKCLGCHRGACSGHPHDQAFGAPSEDTSFKPMHHYPNRHSDPRLKSYMEQLGNLLFSDADPDNSADTGNSGARRGDPPTADHGQSKRRKKISDVWDYFTKIFARDINGKVVTYAACNHCCKILSASSKNGTSQLARHACPCKFKPVEAGRNAKDSGGDVNVLSS